MNECSFASAVSDEELLRESSKEKRDSIDVVLTAFDSIRCNLAYVSMSVITGKRSYEVLEKYGVRTLGELARLNPCAIEEEIRKPNAAEGVAIADRIAKLTSLPVLAPARFEASRQNWKEDEYMYLWYKVLDQKVAEHYLADDWEYVVGSVKEYVRTFELQNGLRRPFRSNLMIYTQERTALLPDRAIPLIVCAVDNLKKRGFDACELEQSLQKLVSYRAQ